MNAEEQGLKALRDKMSVTQRQEMAEIISNEMKRRGMKVDGMPTQSTERKQSKNLSRDQVGELYRDISDAVRTLREKKVDEKLANLRQQIGKSHPQTAAAAPREERPRPRIAPVEDSDYEEMAPRKNSALPKIALLGAIIALGAAKLMLSTTDMSSREEQPSRSIEIAAKSPAAPAAAVAAEPAAETIKLDFSNGSLSPTERKLLLELDTRRVQLEQRKEALDRRELDIRNQSQVLSERLAELRSMTSKLAEAKQEKDQRYQTRLEQLANVYGAMSPEEAAGLISRLEDDTAIELLQRMPEKRMGQILGFMDKDRAVDLTKILTDKSGTLG